METFLAAIFSLSAIVAVPTFVVSAYNSRVFDRYLRENHPDTWAKIAPPSGTEPSASAPSVRFITKKSYRTIGDSHLNVLSDRCFRSGYWAVSVVLVLILSGVAYATLKA
jgi:hypothetical protein